MEPRLIVDGRFVLDAGGVSRYVEDSLVRASARETSLVTLGDVFYADETPLVRPTAAPGAQLLLIRNGQEIAMGRLDRLGDQSAFIVETT